MLITRAENEGPKVRTFVRLLCIRSYISTFEATPTLMFAHAHFCNPNMWLIMWVCSMKVEAVLLAAFVLFLSPAVPNLDRNTNRNHTSSRYKAIILFWKLSIANQGKTNIDKNTCEPSFLFADEASKAVFLPSSQPY